MYRFINSAYVYAATVAPTTVTPTTPTPTAITTTRAPTSFGITNSDGHCLAASHVLYSTHVSTLFCMRLTGYVIIPEPGTSGHFGTQCTGAYSTITSSAECLAAGAHVRMNKLVLAFMGMHCSICPRTEPKWGHSNGYYSDLGSTTWLQFFPHDIRKSPKQQLRCGRQGHRGS